MSGAAIRAGVCVLDATPPPGLAMSGFAARAGPAIGAHDALTVRAIVVDDTALVVADVIGLTEASCARIRAASPLPDAHVVVAATHTHGGPVVSPGRLGARCDAAYLNRLEGLCVEAVTRACARREPASLAYGEGSDPDVARNRRHCGGLVDRRLPVVWIRSASGQAMAVVVSYACHPVTLAADNRLYTADYPQAVRTALEAHAPGAVAVFLTGCAGEANMGHSAQASMSAAPQPLRSFAEAERIGCRIADAALAARLSPMSGPVRAGAARVDLRLERRAGDLALPVQAWRRERAKAAPARAALLQIWLEWATQVAPKALTPIPAHVALLDWCGVRIAALPGEIFAATGLDIHRRMLARGARGVVTLAYANGCPGYIPPSEEYGFGGYEIDEAHRYYGQPAAFAPDSADRLVETLMSLAGEA